VNFDGDGDGDELCATGTTKHTWTIWNAAAPHEWRCFRRRRRQGQRSRQRPRQRHRRRGRGR